MSRAQQIISGYASQNDVDGLGAMQVLALAHDQAVERWKDAEKRAAEAERRVRSTIDREARALLSGYEVSVIQPVSDPTAWRISLEPLRFETRMISAPPRKWEPAMFAAVVEHFGEMIKRAVAEKMMKS